VSSRYVVDENGKRVGGLLDIVEYERMVEELEEFEDILARVAYDEAKAELERGEDELIS
jgi:PHD/YefM family antitoxin component YafN of YafNO toxin-antitoxin module